MQLINEKRRLDIILLTLKPKHKGIRAARDKEPNHTLKEGKKEGVVGESLIIHTLTHAEREGGIVLIQSSCRQDPQ